MNRVLILFTQQSIDRGQADPQELRRLLETAAGRSLQIDTAIYDDLSYKLQPDSADIFVHSTNRSMTDYDFVYLRRIKEGIAQAITVGKFCRAKGILCIDSEIALRPGSMGKLTQYMQFALAKLPFPDTIYAVSHDTLLQTFDDSGLQFPVIMKSVSGSRGSDNHLVQARTDMVRLLTAYPETHFLIQKYIPNTADYRVWVLGDTIGPVLRRSRTTGHLNNTSQGGEAVLLEGAGALSETVRTACIRAAHVLDRDVAGVDVVFEHDNKAGNFYFFEVNRAPQIEATPHAGAKAAALVNYITAAVAAETGRDDEV